MYNLYTIYTQIYTHLYLNTIYIYTLFIFIHYLYLYTIYIYTQIFTF